MGAIVSSSAYRVVTQLLFCPADRSCERATWSSSEYCWRGTAAFWHGIVQHFIVEISPFVTAGHIGSESSAAFNADKSNSYVLGKSEIVGFSSVLWTSQVVCWLLVPDSSSSGPISHFMYDLLFLLPSFSYKGGSVSFFCFSLIAFSLVVVWPFHLLGSKDDVWPWKWKVNHSFLVCSCTTGTFMWE